MANTEFVHRQEAVAAANTGVASQVEAVAAGTAGSNQPQAVGMLVAVASLGAVVVEADTVVVRLAKVVVADGRRAVEHRLLVVG
ncbi:MAG: hypothetical protein FWG47_05735 [Propionibacteriaceae bacterium]|nr:hypothetical protein [Propionibacteriaceae bacterium]